MGTHPRGQFFSGAIVWTAIYLILIVHRNAHKNQFTKNIDSKCLTNTFIRIYTGKMFFQEKLARSKECENHRFPEVSINVFFFSKVTKYYGKNHTVHMIGIRIFVEF